VEVESKKQDWSMAYKISVGYLAFMQLITLLYIHTAEKSVAGQGWYLRLAVVGPWFFCLLTGAGLFMQVRRKQVSEQVAQNVLGALGIILMFVYDAIFELAKFVH
jgi:hypothetical protein